MNDQLEIWVKDEDLPGIKRRSFWGGFVLGFIALIVIELVIIGYYIA